MHQNSCCDKLPITSWLITSVIVLLSFNSAWTPAIGQTLPTDRVIEKSIIKFENQRPKINLNNIPIEEYSLKAAHSTTTLNIDGLLNEAIWLTADSIEQFYQNYPFDTGYAANRTIVRVVTDADNLYISAVCYDEIPGRHLSSSLARDWSHRDTDGFEWFIDPFLDKTNGFGFGISAYNAQREGLISGGGNNGINTAWDNKWYSAVKHYPGRWVAEVAIPFKTLRYKDGLPYWRMNFARTDYKRNELSIWVPMYRNYSISNLGYTGKVHFEKPIAKAGSNISIIPYVGSVAQNDFLARKAPEQFVFNAGVDAKVALSSSMNLDMTVNPDFSQVEVDRQVTNLSRFEIFFPERRNFFLENQDLFDNYGSGRARAFFSRRIGLVYDTSLQLFVNNPIWFGSRVSGKIDQNWRLGVLTTQTANNPNADISSRNFNMVSVQRRVGDRSYIGAYGMNRESFGTPGSFGWPGARNDFFRSAGMEYNLVTAGNRWAGKAWTQFSQRPGIDVGLNSSAQGANIAYNDRTWYMALTGERVGSSFSNEMGFLPRRNYSYAAANLGYTLVPESGMITSYSPSASASAYWMPDLRGNVRLTDYSTDITLFVSDVKTRYLNVTAGQEYVYLFSPFDPTNSGKQRLEAGTEYTTQYVRASFNNDMRKPFYYTVSSFYGGYYNGSRMTNEASVNYRYMPYLSLGISGNHTYLNLPEPWGENNLWLLGPNMNLTLTEKLFIKAYYQYNSQIDNMNLNARVQWRYLPASDMFLVFTQNYFISNEPNRIKNTALVFKLSYWFNA